MHSGPKEKPAPDGPFLPLRRRGRPRKGGDFGANSTFLKPGEKNTKAHWMARLDRDRPDLAARVRAGAMTANAAAVEAGFRKRTRRKKSSSLGVVETMIG
jgi:hypothetical protein